MNAPRPPLFDQLRRAAPQISVGMLTADLASLGSELKLLETAGVKLAHFDVMDGVFCPMTTFGPPVISACQTALFRDVHLMIDSPLDKLPAYVAAGADLLTVQIESTRHVHRTFQALAAMTNATDPARGLVRGVGLCPGTPVEAVEPLLDHVELVMLLAVNPGWGGQRFITTTGSRLARLRQLLTAAGADLLLGIDGGVTRENLAEVLALQPDLVVTGSAVFDGRDPAANAAWMVKAAQSAPRRFPKPAGGS